MLRGNPPPPTSFFFFFFLSLFLHFSKKKSENFGGGGLNPPLNMPLTQTNSDTDASHHGFRVCECLPARAGLSLLPFPSTLTTFTPAVTPVIIMQHIQIYEVAVL